MNQSPAHPNSLLLASEKKNEWNIHLFAYRIFLAVVFCCKLQVSTAGASISQLFGCGYTWFFGYGSIPTNTIC